MFLKFGGAFPLSPNMCIDSWKNMFETFFITKIISKVFSFSRLMHDHALRRYIITSLFHSPFFIPRWNFFLKIEFDVDRNYLMNLFFFL